MGAFFLPFKRELSSFSALILRNAITSNAHRALPGASKQPPNCTTSRRTGANRLKSVLSAGLLYVSDIVGFLLFPERLEDLDLEISHVLHVHFRSRG